jgi:hypothetical protein
MSIVFPSVLHHLSMPKCQKPEATVPIIGQGQGGATYLALWGLRRMRCSTLPNFTLDTIGYSLRHIFSTDNNASDLRRRRNKWSPAIWYSTTLLTVEEGNVVLNAGNRCLL